MSTISIALQQPSLLGFCPITEAVETLSHQGDEASRGAVYTRREVAEFILDLCGYTSGKPLYQMSLLEPSFGRGDFLLPAVARLLQAWQSAGSPGPVQKVLGPCIRAVELHHPTFLQTGKSLLSFLIEHGIDDICAQAVLDEWLRCGDYLLMDLPSDFDVVVGNPPYVRQEMVSPVLMAEYRRRYSTIYDRADLYIPFIEKSLKALKNDGILGFICADRWMKNRYGGPLRRLVAKDFHLHAYVDMSEVAAFESQVVAYPAVTIMGREQTGLTRIAFKPDMSVQGLSRLASQLSAPSLDASAASVQEIAAVTSGEEPWILEPSGPMALLRRLERGFPALEETGCKVGIGVATGADKAFIGAFDDLDVEEDRKLPLVMTRDIESGRIVWQGKGVINPFKEGPGSGLVNLAVYPRLQRYLEARRDVIAARHVSKKSPAQWYRTIDRITPSLTHTPKLLVPDIKGKAQVVFDEGHFYPHHNLYFITSTQWDLQALQAVLLSSVARFFVESYSTKMRGGFLRFQAQYLRRIRLPRWEDVPATMRRDLCHAARSMDRVTCDRVAGHLYGLTADEMAILDKNITTS